MTRYHVARWDNNIVVASFSELTKAKRHCRKLGYTDIGHPTCWAPIAMVQNDQGECVYNPRFKKQ